MLSEKEKKKCRGSVGEASQKGEKKKVDKKKRKEEADTKDKVERKIGRNLLYNINEGKSGAKPEGKKKQEITLRYKKCTEKSVGFLAVSGLDDVKGLLQFRICSSVILTKQSEGTQRRDRVKGTSSGIRKTELQRRPQSV